jgi:peptidoglycan hydrolase-like protein with peptidoglycan-binding domain
MTDSWVEVPDSEELEHDGAPIGSDEDLDATGYDAGDDPASRPPLVLAAPSVATGAKGDRGIPYPVVKAAIPAWVKKYGNGTIPQDKMIKVAPIGSGYLVPEAAAAWRNLQNAAAVRGFTLTMTGAYRTFQGQKDLFLQRYTTTNTGRKSKVWNNRTYWLKPGMAMAAVPGTSNHGWGCAVDAALGGYGNAAKSVGEPFLSWAVNNARRLGWSWEVQSEPWHLRLVSFSSADSGHGSDTEDKSGESHTSPEPPQPILRVGSRGGQVAVLQNLCLLFKWGDCRKADGMFGPRTEAAVKVMQTAIGVAADGEYGPRSAAALRATLRSMPR